MWDPQSLRGDLHGKSIPHPLSHRCAGRNEDMSAELSDRESPGPRVRRLSVPALDDSSEDGRYRLFCLDPCHLGFSCCHSGATAD